MLNRSSNPAEQLHSVSLRSKSAWPSARHATWVNTAKLLHIPQPAASVPSDEDAALRRLEAILFFAREPVNSRKLSQYANLADGTQARTLIRRLNEQFDAAGRAFRVERVAGGYQMLTRRAFAPWLRRLAHVPGESRLSAPALETLTVIAYRQPVGRADIEAIRGVNCGEILRQLMDRDFVRIAGRSQELGRPYLYATTKRFLELFGLNHLDDLPRADELRTATVPRPLAIAGEVNESATPEFCEPPIDENASESTFG